MMKRLEGANAWSGAYLNGWFQRLPLTKGRAAEQRPGYEGDNALVDSKIARTKVHWPQPVSPSANRADFDVTLPFKLLPCSFREHFAIGRCLIL